VCVQVVAADASLDPADVKALYATTSRKILAARFAMNSGKYFT
jgi:hypothetical protein